MSAHLAPKAPRYAILDLLNDLDPWPVLFDTARGTVTLELTRPPADPGKCRGLVVSYTEGRGWRTATMFGWHANDVLRLVEPHTPKAGTARR